MEAHVLIVDDEVDLLLSVEYALTREGFDTSTAETGRSALAQARAKRPDLVLLDWMLPDVSGVQVCKQLKANPETAGIPVMMLTAKGDLEHRIEGLEAGAEDYLVKPFSMRELVLRVRALVQRSSENESASEEGAEHLSFGTLRMDMPAHRAWIEEEEIDLTALEFKLLRTLLLRRGRVQTRDTLLRDVWEVEAGLQTRTVDTHMKRLRQKLGGGGDWIETIRGVGYRFSEVP
jgi:two-component system phosphate regulon response regulator PhoB